MMRARFPAVTALALLLAACSGGGGREAAPAASPLTGGAVAVTSLDAPAATGTPAVAPRAPAAPAAAPPRPAAADGPAAPGLQAELDALRATAAPASAAPAAAPVADAPAVGTPASGTQATAAPAADAPAAEGEAPPPKPRSAAQIACEGAGGTWARAGATVAMTCFRPTGDGGRSCRKESDCSTLCLARSRSCAPVTPLFGCHPILQDDGREVTLCLD